MPSIPPQVQATPNGRPRGTAKTREHNALAPQEKFKTAGQKSVRIRINKRIPASSGKAKLVNSKHKTQKNAPKETSGEPISAR